MNNQIRIRKYIDDILQTCRLSVLATESQGKPYASLIAITPFKNFRRLIFATYRNTRKFENMLQNGNVAILIQGEDIDSSDPQKGYALTAFGQAQEIGLSELNDAVQTHLKKHPDLENLLHSTNFAIIQIRVEAYQIVRGIDDVIWWPVSAMTET